MTTKELLDNLLAQVQDDTGLTDDVKDSLVELIDGVSADPSPDNFKALAIVLEKLADTTQYLSALETIKTMEAVNSDAGSTPPSTPPVA